MKPVRQRGKMGQAETKMIKAEITDKEWEDFKKLVHPIPAQVALGTMIRSAIDSETKPFSSVVEGIIRSAFRGSPS